MKVHPWGRLHVSRRTATGLAVLGLLTGLCLLGAAERASWIVDRLLGDWAGGAIAEQTGGAYQLHLGHTRFDWARRRFAMDSISLTTSPVPDGGRPQALPGLRFGLYDCTISGVHFFALVRRAGLIARSFGCQSGHLMVEVPLDSAIAGPQAPGLAPAVPDQRQVMLAFQRGIALPFYAPRVRIGRVAFPHLALEVRLPRSAGGATRLQLQRLEWTMEDVAIDPSDSAAASRLLFSRRIELQATNFTTHPTRASAVRVGLLRASLTDSTLDARAVTFVPVASDSAPAYRTDRIRLTAGHVTFQGIDFKAFVFGRGARARSVDVDSARLDVLSDERLPEGPRGRPHRTPQQWIADVDQTLSIDSLRVHHGEVVYREHASGRAQSGVITFARIEAVATNIRHVAGRLIDGAPLALTARAQLQGVGQLDLFAEVPLDAPRFDMSLHGTLGAMAAPVLNTFVVETNALRINNGQVAGVVFNVMVQGGVARGAITPRFNDLSLSVTRSGSGGIAGSGGILGGAARGIETLAAKLVVVRGDNPHGAEQARVGTIRRTFTPDLTLVSFLWRSVRDGLLLVVKK